MTLSIYNTPNFLPFGTVFVSSGTSVSMSANFTTTESKEAESCMVYNAGTSTAFVAFADGPVNAVVPTSTESSNSTPVASGAIVVLKKQKNSNTVSSINGLGNVYFTAGEGT